MVRLSKRRFTSRLTRAVKATSKDKLKYVEYVKATMAFEGKNLSPQSINLGKKILLGEITGDDARKELARKYNL